MSIEGAAKMAIARRENKRLGPLMAKKVLDRINARKPVGVDDIKKMDEELRESDGT